jgi:hypothetical protein
VKNQSVRTKKNGKPNIVKLFAAKINATKSNVSANRYDRRFAEMARLPRAMPVFDIFITPAGLKIEYRAF